jgi:hypothetical protein
VSGAHTAIYLVMASSVLAILYAGIVDAHRPWLFVALGLVAVEVAVFVGNGRKCPLTGVAAKYGALSGAETFLPERFTRHTLQIFGPQIVIGVLLLMARWFGIFQ